MAVIDREVLTDSDLNNTIRHLQREIAQSLNTKGRGAFVSRHEIIGAVSREFWELQQTLDGQDLDIFAEELLDIASCCIVGAAGIYTNKTGC